MSSQSTSGIWIPILHLGCRRLHRTIPQKQVGRTPTTSREHERKIQSKPDHSRGWREEWSATFLVARRLGRIKKKGLSACMARRPKAPCGVSKPSMLFNPSLHLGCRRLNRTIRKNKLGRVLHPTLSSGGMSQPSARYAEGASSWVKKKRGTRQDQASPLTKGVV